MKNTVEQILMSHGTDLTIVSEKGSRTVRGFFRAVNSQSSQSMESEATLLGEISRGQYAYLGPAEEEILEGDTILLEGRAYLVRRMEQYFFGNEVLYRWGLCVEKGVNDTWGSQS